MYLNRALGAKMSSNSGIPILLPPPSGMNFVSRVMIVCVTNFALGFGAGYAYAQYCNYFHPEDEDCKTTKQGLAGRDFNGKDGAEVESTKSATASSVPAYRNVSLSTPSEICVTGLFVYPIKACAGHSVTSARVTARGLENDRLFMVVDFTGRHLNQKKYPTLALVKPTILDSGEMRVEAPGMDTITFQPKSMGEKSIVFVYGVKCEGVDQGDAIGEFFAKFLEVAGIRLVRMRDGFVRKGRGDFQSSFADSHPFLLAGESSQLEVSRRVGRDMEMRRYRPNVVVKGASPFEEDGWKRVRIGNGEFEIAKRCTRCKVVTVDPDTGKYDEENQPTETLREFRRFGQTVCFGQNIFPVGLGKEGGVLSVGDVLTVLQVLVEVPQPDIINSSSERSPKDVKSD